MARTSRKRTTKKVEEPKQEVKETPEVKEEEVKPVEEPKQEEVKAEEPKKEEKPKNNKPKVSAKDIDVNSPAFVENVLKSAKTLEELFQELKKSNLTRMIVTRLEQYAKEMDTKRVVTPEKGVARNYDLYNLIISVAKQPDYNKFKLQFDVINKVFLLGKNGVFNPIQLSRFDYVWRWGIKSKSNYEKLVELISTMANPGDRRKVKINVAAAVEGLNDTIRENITKYYTM